MLLLLQHLQHMQALLLLTLLLLLLLLLAWLLLLFCQQLLQEDAPELQLLVGLEKRIVIHVRLQQFLECSQPSFDDQCYQCSQQQQQYQPNTGPGKLQKQHRQRCKRQNNAALQSLLNYFLSHVLQVLCCIDGCRVFCCCNSTDNCT
jgi:hypothetical protein